MPGERHDAAVRLHQRIIAGPVTKRPVRAERGDRAVDETRIDLAGAIPSEAELLEDTGPKRLHEHVRTADQSLDDRASLRGLHVDGQATLVAIDAHEGGAFLAPVRRG